MKDPHYRNALRFGWAMAWKHPYLWIYGLFAAVLGQMGLFDFFSGLVKAVSWNGGFAVRSYLQMPRLLIRGFVMSSWSLPLHGWVWLLWLGVLFVGFLLHVIVAAVISQGALIHVAAQGKTLRGVSHDGREWHVGVEHFWRILGVNILRKAVIGILAVIIGFAGWNAIASGAPSDNIVFLALFVIAALVGMVLSFFVIYAAGYIVIEEYPFFKALGAAWQLFLDHWLVSMEVGAMFLLFNILLALAAVLGFFILLLPTLLLWFFAVVTINHVIFTAAIVFFVAALALFICFLGSFFTVFSTAVWTYLFVTMHRVGVKSRILHLLR